MKKQTAIAPNPVFHPFKQCLASLRDAAGQLTLDDHRFRTRRHPGP